MITIKSTTRNDELNADGKVNIKIRITNNRKSRFLATEHYIEPKYFDTSTGRIKKAHPFYNYINIELDKLELGYRQKLLKIENCHSKNISEIVLLLKPGKLDFDFNVYTHFKAIQEDFRKRGSNTCRHYKEAEISMKKYRKGDFLDIREIDVKYLNGFLTYFYSKGKSTNGIGVDLRCIRAVFNRLINEDKLDINYYPFRRFKIKKQIKAPKSLTLEQMKNILKSGKKRYELYAIDVFWLSFCLIGINLVDLYYLKKTDIHNGRIEYERAKTHRAYSILIEPEAAGLVEKYIGTFSEKYKSVYMFTKSTNIYLKRIGKREGLPYNLTSYFARYSWGSIAANNGVAKEDISAALGHGQKTVTDYYIDFDRNRIDNANRKVLNLFK